MVEEDFEEDMMSEDDLADDDEISIE